MPLKITGFSLVPIAPAIADELIEVVMQSNDFKLETKANEILIFLTGSKLTSFPSQIQFILVINPLNW